MMRLNKKKVFFTLVGIFLFVWTSFNCQFRIFNEYVVFPGFVLLTLFCYTCGALCGTLVGSIGALTCTFLMGFQSLPITALNNLILGVVLGKWFAFTKHKKVPKKSKKWFHFFVRIFTPITKLLPNIIVIGGTFVFLLVLHSFICSITRGYPFEVFFSHLKFQYLVDFIVVLFTIQVCKLFSTLVRKIRK